MSNKQSSDKTRIVPLLIGFLILFVVTFSLGIIVGMGVSERSFKSAQKDADLQSEPLYSEEPQVLDYEDYQALRQDSPEPFPPSEDPPLEPTEEESTDLIVNEEIIDESETLESSLPEPEQDKIAEVPTDPEPVPTPEPPKEIRKAEIEESAKTDQNKREGRPKLPPIDPKGIYTVQIGSFTDKNAAESVLSSMKRKGYPAFINSMTDSGKKKWYRVRIGTFKSSQTASEYGENLKVLEPEVKIVFITQNN